MDAPLEHDPEKLQTFRIRSCCKSRSSERDRIQAESIALQRNGAPSVQKARPAVHGALR
jgi:hypothetical protein